MKLDSIFLKYEFSWLMSSVFYTIDFPQLIQKKIKNTNFAIFLKKTQRLKHVSRIKFEDTKIVLPDR